MGPSSCRLRTILFLSFLPFLFLVPLKADAPFIRADVDANGSVEITDAIALLGHLFLGNPSTLDCVEATDANSDGGVDMSDAVFILLFLFLGDRPPAVPFPGCGTDAAFTSLGCKSFPACEVTRNSIGMIFVYILPGGFFMGAPDSERGRSYMEGPQHKVNISKGFYMGTTPVTQGQYLTVMGANPSYFNGVRDNTDYGMDMNRPVEQVNWFDANDFCTKLSVIEGRTYRLPSEAEWEYACRAGTTTRFSFGDALECDDWSCTPCSAANDYMWWCGNYQDPSENVATRSVGTKKPNRWGLYDMHGSLLEWCQDWFETYPTGEVTDPVVANPSSIWGDVRVLRDGFWRSQLGFSRSAARMPDTPVNIGNFKSFRVVLEAGR